MDYTPQQIEEIKKCRKDFAYFCETYIKIIHPIKGLIPFKLYEFQKRIISYYDIHPFNIVSKFRQAGLTTTTVIWCMWRCLFYKDQRIMTLTKSDREVIGISKIVQNAKESLPDWLKPQMRNDNDHEKEFVDTGGVMWFYNVQAARSRSLTYLVIDEAAFIQSMDEHWKAMYPTLAAGGNCIVVSTVNGVGNWYHETYVRAQDKKNQFHVIDLDYTEHPEYNNPEWVKRMRSNLTEKGWKQEILRNFLGSGETYIDGNIIADIRKGTKDPIRKLFPEWENSTEDSWEEMDLKNDEYVKGAMWVWKEPEPSREYLITADAAEGVGDEGDNSAFHILDMRTLEQCASFESNNIQPHKFAQILGQIGIYYNNSLLVVENDTGPGLATLSRLQHNIYYDNLYYSPRASGQDKAGITLNKTLRPVYLEVMQTCLINKLVKINDIRFVRQLETFIFNNKTQKAQAQKGKHDDFVISLAIGLHVSEVLNREMPPGAEIAADIIGMAVVSNTDDIKRMLEEGLPDDFFDEEMEEIEFLPKMMVGEDYPERKMEAFLRSFGF